MKSYRKELWFKIPNRRGFVNITRRCRNACAKAGSRKGLCLVNAMHITASVFINDDESGLHHDYEDLAGEAGTARTGRIRTGTTARARTTPTRT